MSQALRRAPTERGERPRSLNRLLVAKLVYGMVLLAAAPLVPGRVGRDQIDRRARVGAAAVGARNLVEVAIICKRPTATAITVTAAIDITHAVSMLILAVARPSRLRLATASGATSVILAGAALTAARRVHRVSVPGRVMAGPPR